MATKKTTKKAAKKSSKKSAKKTVKKAAPKKGMSKAANKVTKKAARKPAFKIGPDGRPILPLGKGKLGYTTSNVFKQSIEEVWDAVTKPEHLKKHFVDDMIGEFGPDKKLVSWVWNEWGPWPFEVTKYVKHQEIVFVGDAANGKHKVTMRFEFVRKDDKTIFRVHETGYDPKDLATAFMMCEGWTEFHSGVKFYLATGMDPRKI